MQEVNRPFGILALMGYLGLKAIFYVVVIGMMQAFLSSAPPIALLQLAPLMAMVYGLFGVLIAIHVLQIHIVYKAKSWARYVVVGLLIFSVINAIINAVSYSPMIEFIPMASTIYTSSIVFGIFDVIAIYYLLFRAEAKLYFKKKQVTSGSAAIR